MRSVNLTTLLLRTRQRADIESATARFPDSEITDHINESIAELYDLLKAVRGTSYYRAVYPITTTSGVATYALPADFDHMISVDAQVASGYRISCPMYMEAERNAFRFVPLTWVLGEPLYWQLQGNNINFIPDPPAGTAVSLNYVTTAPKLVSGGDTFDGIAGWEEYVVLDAAIKCLLKEQDFETVGVLEGRKAAMKTRINDLASERDGTPMRVQDVYQGPRYRSF